MNIRVVQPVDEGSIDGRVRFVERQARPLQSEANAGRSEGLAVGGSLSPCCLLSYCFGLAKASDVAIAI
jgi:hypothetical protein